MAGIETQVEESYGDPKRSEVLWGILRIIVYHLFLPVVSVCVCKPVQKCICVYSHVQSVLQPVDLNTIVPRSLPSENRSRARQGSGEVGGLVTIILCLQRRDTVGKNVPSFMYIGMDSRIFCMLD